MSQNAFNEIPEVAFTPAKDIYGVQTLDNISSMQIGAGAKSFKGDQSGIWLGANKFANAPFSVDMDGNVIATGATITGMGQNFVSTLAWTATDIDTATWAGGTIKTSDGTTYSIAGNDTGNIAALTYVYLDPATSIVELQTTTTAATAMGTGKIVIAIVQLGASGAGCIIDVIGSSGTTIDGDKIVTGKIQSADGKTYFDLDNARILMVDASSVNRVVIGSV